MLPGSINVLYGDEIGLKDSVDPFTNKCTHERLLCEQFLQSVCFVLFVQEYRGGQLCPMPWDVGLNGNFSTANITLWIPLNSNYVKNNINRQTEAVSRLQQLIKFRKNNFVVKSIKKHGNYLFHYINDGEIVLERYFSNMTNDGTVTRERFVLFANLGREVNVKSFLAKFHLANIEIASNPNRLTQFLYIGSLRLDPGEAIIARLV
ncbi:maltase A2-like protein [Leptotrombidium deliense]|uniref:Maltase A2-like protein n=1 Tax=Leptotrombidium deliense TaxID=299467 RepID=A0A443SE96_9ACAR|nr:maltase A2-like protein [Leptotrombidium deliense]